MSSADDYTAQKLHLNAISRDDPLKWIEKGWSDIKRAPLLSLSFGVIFVLIGIGITLGMWALELSAATPAAMAGFAFLAPLLAVGLYEISRRLETGEPLSFGAVYFVKTAAPSQLAMICVFLMLFFLAWARIASLLFALFIQGDYPPFSEFTSYVLTNADGLALLVVGSALGAALGFAAFAISAISVPLLMHRDVDVVTAMALSVQAVRKQTGPMLVWAWLIALGIGISMVTLFLGLIFIFPLFGHATWHAYRSLVAD